MQLVLLTWRSSTEVSLHAKRRRIQRELMLNRTNVGSLPKKYNSMLRTNYHKCALSHHQRNLFDLRQNRLGSAWKEQLGFLCGWKTFWKSRVVLGIVSLFMWPHAIRPSNERILAKQVHVGRASGALFSLLGKTTGMLPVYPDSRTRTFNSVKIICFIANYFYLLVVFKRRGWAKHFIRKETLTKFLDSLSRCSTGCFIWFKKRRCENFAPNCFHHPL